MSALTEALTLLEARVPMTRDNRVLHMVLPVLLTSIDLILLP